MEPPRSCRASHRTPVWRCQPLTSQAKLLLGLGYAANLDLIGMSPDLVLGRRYSGGLVSFQSMPYES
jgi:hypothetical protein